MYDENEGHRSRNSAVFWPKNINIFQRLSSDPGNPVAIGYPSDDHFLGRRNTRPLKLASFQQRNRSSTDNTKGEEWDYNGIFTAHLPTVFLDFQQFFGHGPTLFSVPIVRVPLGFHGADVDRAPWIFSIDDLQMVVKPHIYVHVYGFFSRDVGHFS